MRKYSINVDEIDKVFIRILQKAIHRRLQINIHAKIPWFNVVKIYLFLHDRTNFQGFFKLVNASVLFPHRLTIMIQDVGDNRSEVGKLDLTILRHEFPYRDLIQLIFLQSLLFSLFSA